MLKRLLGLSLLIMGALLYAIFNQPAPPTPIDAPLVKISARGEPLDIWSGPWNCVYDKRSGLLWEVKTDAEDIHHTSWTFSWFNENLGVENSGDCYFETTRCDTADLLRRANKKKLCGNDSWRLPTANELSALVTHTAQPGEAVIESDFFPHIQRGDYWTIDHGKKLLPIYGHLGTGALTVNFIDGSVTALPYRNAAFVILVSDNTHLTRINP